MSRSRNVPDAVTDLFHPSVDTSTPICSFGRKQSASCEDQSMYDSSSAKGYADASMCKPGGKVTLTRLSDQRQHK